MALGIISTSEREEFSKCTAEIALAGTGWQFAR